MTATFQAVNARVQNAGVRVTFLDLDGTDTAFVVSEYGSAAAGRASAKLVTAGDSKVLVRVRGMSADVTATLKVEKIGE